MTTNMTVEIDNKIIIELSDVWIINRESDTKICLKTKYNAEFTFNISDKESTDKIYETLVKGFKLSHNSIYDYNKD